MNWLANLFASDTGQFLASLFMIIGLSNFIFPFFIFGKKIKGHRSKLHPELSGEEKSVLETEIKQLKMLQRTVIAVGIAFVLIGIYGLARTKGA
jgi:hypothetical protein